MNIQIFGKSKCFDTKKAERWFKERRVKYQSIDLIKYGMSGKEFDSVLRAVGGVDQLDGTPIYDIKPYVEYADAHVGVRSGFVDEKRWQKVEVCFPDELRTFFSDEDFAALCKVLELDPRPQYHSDPERVYGMPFAGYDVRFKVSNEGVLEVIDVKAEN